MVGIMDDLGALGVGIAALAITLVVVFVMLSQTASNSVVTADSNATKTVKQMQEAANDIPGWIPLVIIAFVGIIILGLVRQFSM